jgi:TolB protein
VFDTDRDANRDIHVASTAGRRRTLVSTSAAELDPSWSADGRRLAFTSDRAGDADIWTVRSNGRGVRRLVGGRGIQWSPEWAPRGCAIAFASDRDGDDEIYVADCNGRRIRQLTHNRVADYEPAWSPNARRIVFTRHDGDFTGIWVMPSSGGRARQVIAGTSCQCTADWSPDGRRLAFSDLFALDRFRIRLLGASGELTTLRNVTAPKDADDFDPSWSPDGRWLVLRRLLDDGSAALYRVRPDGTGLEIVVDGRFQPSTPSWQPLPVRGRQGSVRLGLQSPR